MPISLVCSCDTQEQALALLQAVSDAQRENQAQVAAAALREALCEAAGESGVPRETDLCKACAPNATPHPGLKRSSALSELYGF